MESGDKISLYDEKFTFEIPKEFGTNGNSTNCFPLKHDTSSLNTKLKIVSTSRLNLD